MKPNALVQTALRTSETKGTPQTESLVELLLEATSQPNQALTLDTLCQWQAALFPEPPLLTQLKIGELRGDATHKLC